MAVVLSVVVISVSFWIQGKYFPTTAQSASKSASSTTVTSPAEPSPAATPATSPIVAETPMASAESTSTAASLPAVEAPVAERTYTIETDLLEAVFTNKGGDLVSLKLKNHKDRSGLVDLIIPGTKDVEGLSVSFGGPGATPVRELLNARMVDDRTIEFYRDFFVQVQGKAEPDRFTYRKVFSFRPGEYMFGMAIGLENQKNEFLPLNQDGTAYTITFGPRIGPSYERLGKNADFRKIVTLQEGKKREERQKNQSWSPKTQPTWSAIAGKYFAFVAIPELASYGTTYTMSSPGATQTTRLALSRPAIQSSRQTDTYYFYFGPKTNAELAKYDYSDRNAFGREGLQLEAVMDRSNLLGWLETALKFAMNMFYKLIPNYGVAIILVTVLVKALLFPLSKKGSIATARMSELQPRMQELQAKYKNNPQKLNQEMAEFYKKEGYNPMSGCLPLLIQFPLFIAMYNLFNTHFDLRGASFIPGWIPDLSLPESILNFGNFRIPILGWNDLRGLPIIYLVSQLLYGKFTQTPQTGPNAGQMKMMMYGMPILFFFILYDVPSGLLIYWIVSNVIQIGQQIVINDIIKKHKAARASVTASKSGKSAKS